MLEQDYKELLRIGYSPKFLNEVSKIDKWQRNGIDFQERIMLDNFRYINIETVGTITKSIAVLDEGNYFKIVEHIKEKNISYDLDINYISRDVVEIMKGL